MKAMRRVFQTFFRSPWQPASVIAVVFSCVCSVQPPAYSQEMFAPGETLRYKVRWSFIRLGTVEIHQNTVDPRIPEAREFTLLVKSAKGLPFINLDITHTVSASLNPLEAKRLVVENGDGQQEKTTYEMNHARQEIIVVDSACGTEVLRDTISIAERCYEALCLLFLARSHASRTGTVVVPTVVSKAVGETILHFTGESEEIDVPAFEDPIEAYHFTGDARWVGDGFGGMKGQFEGWVSRDQAAVPLRAEVGIFLGSIVLELESYERSSWRPLDTASLSPSQPQEGGSPWQR